MRPEPPHSPQPLCSSNLPFVHSEVMRNLMPECLFHQSFQILAGAREALMGTLKYSDSVGQVERFKNTAVGKGTPFVQAEKRAARRDASRLELAGGRLILDYHSDIVHTASE